MRPCRGSSTIGAVFESLFERSADAICLVDPSNAKLLDCNEAAVRLIGAENKDQILPKRPEELSPRVQPDGKCSIEKSREIIEQVQRRGTHSFEWVIRRFDGTHVPVEVSSTAMPMDGKIIHVVISRDVSERKKAERELRDLTQALERRFAERTAELSASEARFRALVEHAPEAIVVFDGDSERILFGNEHACRLYGVPMEKLPVLAPADVSPELQPNGRLSTELAREKMDEALAGGMPVFEWIHRQPNGQLIPTEVRLLRLPAEGRNLIRASIIDNTERKLAERTLRESEEKFRALFEGSSHGVILHDANKLLEVNSAAVRLFGCQNPQELIGRHPGELAPPCQPNGENSAALAAKYIQQCMACGGVRFEWLGRTPNGSDIPLEIALTRIEWSGRQVIQAYITDITERTRARNALAESEARFAAAFQASPVWIGVLRLNDGAYVMANDALVNWLGCTREEVIGHTSAEFGMWENAGDREAALNEMRRLGSICQREYRWVNRRGDPVTVLLSAETIKLNDTPHVLSFALDITERKQAEGELRASEARLRESEKRFSVAFQASPIFIAILRVCDTKFVLVNDALVNWLGCSRDHALGQSCADLGMWADLADRAAVLAELQSVGSIRQRECRWRNLRGNFFTILLSAEVITLDNTPHVLLLGLDITQRKQSEVEMKQSEARLRESETRFSVAFQASPVFISMLRMSDQKYVLANDAFLSWRGSSREDVLGHTSAELGLWEDPEDRLQVWRDLRSSGSIRQKECRWFNRRGGLFTILLSAETIRVDNEPHVLSLALDITQRKRAEEELIKTLNREKELSQLKGNFVSMVSHEFRTPLGIIQSSAELLRDFCRKMQPGEREVQVDSIIRNTRRMAGMMEEVLVLSRLDGGGLDFRPAALDLPRFCRRVVDETLSATNGRCLIQLSLNSVPPEAQADDRLLGHIFTNLLTNAVKYSEPRATVHFTVDREEREAVCVVRDTGIGIPEKDQQQLFKAFQRGTNVGSRPGTGLGLVLVKRCAELHGGTVQVVSKVGVGTMVTVRLPVFVKNHEKNIGN